MTYGNRNPAPKAFAPPLLPCDHSGVGEGQWCYDCDTNIVSGGIICGYCRYGTHTWLEVHVVGSEDVRTERWCLSCVREGGY